MLSLTSNTCTHRCCWPIIINDIQWKTSSLLTIHKVWCATRWYWLSVLQDIWPRHPDEVSTTGQWMDFVESLMLVPHWIDRKNSCQLLELHIWMKCYLNCNGQVLNHKKLHCTTLKCATKLQYNQVLYFQISGNMFVWYRPEKCLVIMFLIVFSVKMYIMVQNYYTHTSWVILQSQ